MTQKQSPIRVYKYKSLEQIDHCLDIINERRLYCAQWKDLNDPMEGQFIVLKKKDYEEATEQRVQQILSEKPKFRICALSLNPSNQAMLSHYADNHKGVIFEIELTPSSNIFHVKYVKEYPEFDVLKGKIKDIAIKIFTFKHQDWEYEKEIRIITQKEYFHFRRMWFQNVDHSYRLKLRTS